MTRPVYTYGGSGDSEAGLWPQKGETMSDTTVYVVRDCGGEYVSAKGGRTPASNEAQEFETREAAQAACERATDRVLSRQIDD